MRTALISDIHGHLPGLEAVLEDIGLRGCDRIVCLGDLVDGGEHDEEVVARIREMGMPVVQGNHDKFNELALEPDTRAYLKDLPDRLSENDILYCHISPRDKMLKVNSVVEAWNVFDETPERLIFTGHQHVPMVYGEKSETFGQATLHAFQYNVGFPLQPDDRYLVCVGSVAYGRDAVGKLRYAIYDAGAQTLEHRLVEGALLPRDYTLLQP